MDESKGRPSDAASMQCAPRIYTNIQLGILSQKMG